MNHKALTAVAAGLLTTGLWLGLPADAAQQQPVVGLDPKAAEAGIYTLDSRHVTLTARVRHLGLGYTSVHFDRIKGTLMWDPDDVTRSQLNVEVDTLMTNTNVPNGLTGGTFAQQIAGPQFLDGHTHPKTTFVSTKITRTDTTHGTIEGNLTLHGVTKPIVLNTEFLGAGLDARGMPRVAFTASAAVNRREFGITAFANEMVADNVLMHIDVEFCRGEQPC